MNKKHLPDSQAEKWFAYRRARPQAQVRLFCFPYSGAGASIFCEWQGMLPEAVEVFPVQLPGREQRLNEAPLTKLTAVLPSIAAAIRPYLDKPFAFFGHSLGAVLCFELARTLRRQDQSLPVHIFVSSHAAPHIGSRHTPIHALPEPEFIARLNEMNGTPAGVLAHAELRSLLLPLLRADFTMSETYQYRKGSPLDCPITALGGLADPYLTRQDLEPWGKQTSDGFKLRLFRGDHFYLHKERPQLLRILAQELLSPT